MKHERLDVGVYESHSDYQQQKSWRRIFDSVISGYIAALSASPLIASNPDDEAITRRLGPEILHFRVDVEHATAHALKSTALYKVWQQIIEGENVPGSMVIQIANKCGPVFQQRGLIPYNYFLRIRKGRRDWRSSVSPAVAA
jgi:hypothetical protein